MSAEETPPGTQAAPKLSTRRLPPRRRVVVEVTRSLLVVAAMGYLVYQGVDHAWKFTIDDSGISYAYARHLARGYGPVAVIGGSIVEGYSNPLWVALLVPLATFDTLTVAAKVLGTLLFVVALGWGARLLGVGARRRWYDVGWEALVPAAILALSDDFVAWVPSGLENPLYAAGLLGLACLDALEARAPARRSWSGLAALAVALTRPEGVVHGLAYGALKGLHAVLRPEHRRQALGYAALFLAPFVVYQILHYLLFLDVFPNTFYAKARPENALSEAWEYLDKSIDKRLVRYVLPLAAVGLVGDVRIKLGLVAQMAVTALFLFYSGGDWMPYARFVSYGMAAMAVLAGFGAYNLARLIAFPVKRFVTAEVFALALVLPAVYFWQGGQKRALVQLERKAKSCHFCRRVRDTQAIDKARGRLSLRTATLLTHDFGGPAWLSSKELYPIDLLGLCDHTLAKFWQYRGQGRPDTAWRLRYQYTFHEQGLPPTFLFFPPNFWVGLRYAPEYDFGYFPVSRRALGRSGAPGYVFAIHRSAFIDYMPPIDRFDFEEVGDSLVLLGARVWSTARGKRPVLTVALLRRTAKAALPSSIVAVARHAGKERKAKTVPLFPGHVSVGGEWTTGEPRRLDIPLPIGADTKGPVDIELRIRTKKHGWAKVPIGVVRPEAIPRPGEYVDHHFPANLPAPRDDSLTEMESRVRRVVDARFRTRDQTFADAELGRELLDVGARLERGGDAEQAYLAYTWAVLADRGLARRLHRRMEPLRSLASNERFLFETALLRKAYSSRSEIWLLRLVAHYVDIGDKRAAGYFAARIREKGLKQAAAAALLGHPTPRAIPKSLPGITSDFEGAEIQGWKLDPKSFEKTPYAVGVEGRPLYRGHGGSHVLSSRIGLRRSGAARTVPFRIEADTLSFSTTARGSGGEVRLLVAGKVVRRARATGTGDFRMVFWDVEPLRGKEAVLELQSSRGPNTFAAVDDIRLWN